MTISPMPKPAIFGAFGETAVPKTAQSRKTVSTASMKMACPAPRPGARLGVPRCVASAAASEWLKNAWRTRPARSAPMSCAAQ